MPSHRTEQGSATPSELPIIDVGYLRDNDQAKSGAIARNLGSAARDIGFFRIVNHGISRELIEATYDMAHRFFALPEEQKREYFIGNSKNHRGYVPFSEKGNYVDEVHRNYEAFDMGLDLPSDDPDFLSGNLLLGPNVWPEIAGFREIVSQYYLEISSLGRLICAALEQFLGISRGSITGNMTKPISQLRMLHYVRPAHAVNTSSVNMGAHTDYECLTLLHTRNEGLQVMTANDVWIDVPVDFDAYVVNIGDMLEAWSNGILRSTPHRVINRSAERFSIPYFVAANYDTEIRPFSQLIGVGNSSRYEPFFAGDHLERMLRRDFPYLRQRPVPKTLVGGGDPHSNPFEARILRGNE